MAARLRRAMLRFSRRLERRFVAQDRLLQALQLLARLEAELLRQLAPRGAVGVECLGLPARAVQREHQLAAKRLPERGARHERLELADELGVAPEREVGLDALLEDRQPQLLEPGDLHLREGLVREVRQCRAPPQRQRLAQLGGGRLRVGRPRLGHELLEASEVELAGLDAQHVARPVGGEPALSQQLAQPRHVDLHGLRRGGRWRGPPELVDQAVGGDELVGLEQQQGEQRALPDPAERERPVLLGHLQRPKQAKVHPPASRVRDASGTASAGLRRRCAGGPSSGRCASSRASG